MAMIVGLGRRKRRNEEEGWTRIVAGVSARAKNRKVPVSHGRL